MGIDFSDILYYPEVKTLYLSLIEWPLESVQLVSVSDIYKLALV